MIKCSDSLWIKSDDCNIFIKNLEKKMDNKCLFDTFSAFGNILSCKVARDENGTSRGCGFVQYETEEQANEAIAKVNGRKISGKKVYVGKFIPQEEREKMLTGNEMRFNNVYIKHLSEDIDDTKLREMFQTYGKIISVKVMTDESGESRWFGFVTFESPDDARKAVDDLNGKVLDGKPLYVGRAQKKSERQTEKRRIVELLTTEQMNRDGDTNSHVKNQDPPVHDNVSHRQFSTSGTVRSAKQQPPQVLQAPHPGFFLPIIPQPPTMVYPLVPVRPLMDYRTLYWPSQFQMRAPIQQRAAFPQQVDMSRAHLYLAAALQNIHTKSLLVARQQYAVNVASLSVARAMAAAFRINRNRSVEYAQSPNVMIQPQPQSSTKQEVVVRDQNSSTDTVSDGADVPDRKQLRKRLYSVINCCYPEIADEIVKILLETQNADLWNMLEHHEALSAKIEEAADAVQASEAGSSDPNIEDEEEEEERAICLL